MATKTRALEIEGKTICFHWDDGPTKGMSHEHHFNKDGSLSWKMGEDKKIKEERYAAFKVSEHVFLVSYLSSNGYTLTVALNFEDGSMKAVCGNSKDWYPCTGRFEIVE